MYSEKLVARFLDPTNIGDVASPDGVGEEGNVTCGDVVQVAVKVDQGLITEARFRAQACATAIAAADVCCELVVGWTVTAAQTLELREIEETLGGIPEERLSCAVIGLGALRAALRLIRSQDSTEAPGKV